MSEAPQEPGDDDEDGSRSSVLPAVLGAGLLGVFALALLVKLWSFFWSSLLVVGVGGGIYLVARPRLARLKARRAARRAQKQAHRLEGDKVRSIDDELARLKKNAGGPQ